MQPVVPCAPCRGGFCGRAAGVSHCRDLRAALLCRHLQVCPGTCNHNFSTGGLGPDLLTSEGFNTISSSIWQRRNTSFSLVAGPEARCSEGMKYSCVTEAICVGTLGQHHLITEMMSASIPSWTFLFFFQNRSQLMGWPGQSLRWAHISDTAASLVVPKVGSFTSDSHKTSVQQKMLFTLIKCD